MVATTSGRVKKFYDSREVKNFRLVLFDKLSKKRRNNVIATKNI